MKGGCGGGGVRRSGACRSNCCPNEQGGQEGRVLHQGKTLAQLAQQYTDNLRLVVYNRSAGRGSNAGISHVCCFMVDGGGGQRRRQLRWKSVGRRVLHGYLLFPSNKVAKNPGCRMTTYPSLAAQQKKLMCGLVVYT